MEQNPELALAWQFIESTGTHLFLTGKAGTGKTTFLRKLKQESPKRMVVVAPTGIAAINAGGVTIHSFFQIPFAPYVPESSFSTNGKASYRFRFGKEKINIIRSMDLLVIDEISMVRADLLDAVDEMLRRYRDPYKPFGGVQLLMIGDLQQLAPVVKDEEWQMLSKYYDTPYFFSSRALKQTEYCTIELKTVYRQNDGDFLELLNRIRENHCDPQVLETLNRRYLPGFQPGKRKDISVWSPITIRRSVSTATSWNSFRDVPMRFALLSREVSRIFIPHGRSSRTERRRSGDVREERRLRRAPLLQRYDW